MATIAELVAEDQAVPSRAFMYGRTPLGGADFVRPTLQDGKVVLRSLNTSHTAYRVSAAEYRRIRRHPMRKVGFWSFVPESEAAANDIAFAHRDPEGAGQELYRLRAALRAARGEG